MFSATPFVIPAGMIPAGRMTVVPFWGRRGASEVVLAILSTFNILVDTGQSGELSKPTGCPSELLILESMIAQVCESGLELLAVCPFI